MHVTFRRHYLDQMLSEEIFQGSVLDVGGKKANPRGKFLGSRLEGTDWKYLGIDPETKPDFLCSAEKIPLKQGTLDAVLLSEVVEHLESPEIVLSECARVLRKGGKFVMSIPFLYGVHADPYDFQRWTAEKIRVELKRAGFHEIKIEPMGGALAVLCDVHEMWCFLHFQKSNTLHLYLKITRGLIRKIFLNLIFRWDKKFPFKDNITTGYYVRALKHG